MSAQNAQYAALSPSVARHSLQPPSFKGSAESATEVINAHHHVCAQTRTGGTKLRETPQRIGRHGGYEMI